MKSAVVLGAAAIMALSGCVGDKNPKPQGNESANSTRIATTYQTAADLKPGIAPPKLANLILSGTSIPVELQETRSGNSLTLNWMADPEGKTGGDPVIVESEKYRFSDSYFAFAGTDHEQYDPPIPLVKYPLEVGSTGEWSGLVTLGIKKR